MDLEVTVKASFDAGHLASMRDRCRRHHGHHWTIWATEKTHDGDPADADTLQADLNAIAGEWQDRDLNEMITNFTEITPERLAPWVMERLLSGHRQLTEVLVLDGHVRAKITRVPPLR